MEQQHITDHKTKTEDPRCPRCGLRLIPALGSDKPNYCWDCDRTYKNVKQKGGTP